MKVTIKHLLLPLVVTLYGFGGSLSNEQRQELKEGREKQEIKKVTEAELISGAIERGKKIVTEAEEIRTDPQQLKKLGFEHKVQHNIQKTFFPIIFQPVAQLIQQF